MVLCAWNVKIGCGCVGVYCRNVLFDFSDKNGFGSFYFAILRFSSLVVKFEDSLNKEHKSRSICLVQMCIRNKTLIVLLGREKIA